MVKKLLALLLCLVLILTTNISVFANDNSIDSNKHDLKILESKSSTQENSSYEEGLYELDGKTYNFFVQRNKDASVLITITDIQTNKSDVYSYNPESKKVFLNETTLVAEIKTKKVKVEKPNANGDVNASFTYDDFDYFIEDGDTNFVKVTVAAIAAVLAAAVPCPYTVAIAVATSYYAGATSPYTTFWRKYIYRYYSFYSDDGWYYPYADDIICNFFSDSRRTDCYASDTWWEYAQLP